MVRKNMTDRMKWAAAALALAGLAAGGATVIAQDEGQNPLMQNLPLAIEKSEGCLGVEVAQTFSGKNAIFAWFEDKDAVLKWYWSDTHTSAMRFAGAEPGGHRAPLENVDADGPILVIATIVPGGEDGGVAGLGVSNISIELYQPLPGGAYVGGRFAPDGVQVDHLLNLGGAVPEGGE